MRKNDGFIQLLILVIALIIILSAFGVSLKKIIESPVGQENLAYVWGLIKAGWEAVRDWFLGALQKVIGYVKM